MSNHIFIFGLGYVGRHLATELSIRGWQVTGTTRQPGKLVGEVPDSWTILPFQAGTTLDRLDDHLCKATHLLSTISALSGGDPVLEMHEPEIKKFSGWVGYLSATSVYPNQPKGWVDEDTMPAPVTGRGKARLTAEQNWQEYANAEVFRLAGIYGPQRNPFAELLAGTARIIDKPGQVFNRIHQTDISQTLIAAMDKPRPGRVINLADGKPASQGDVLSHAAGLLGINPPAPIPFETADLSPMARSFFSSCRRVRSNIIGPELGHELVYPDYKKGLEAIHAKQNF